MIPEWRERFNRDFTRAKYQQFLRELDRRSGTHVNFRNCETPCFFPKQLLSKMVCYGKELITQLLSNPEYLAASDRAVPPEYRVPNEDPRPLFVQADFGLDADLQPKLVEIQGFPSLYAYQPMQAQTYADVYGIDSALRYEFVDNYWPLLKKAVLGSHDPENVILMEIDPERQKTLPDFLLMRKCCGIRTVSVTDVKKKGNRLYYGGTPIHRIYNRVIVDELQRKRIQPGFDWRDDLDVEWAGHPNWYFRISKFSLPYLQHQSVPKSWFLSALPSIPGDLENYVLKPLYSFAGLGVVIGPTREQLDGVDKSQFILQEKVSFMPVIETPFGPTKAEVRVMYIWQDQLQAVTTIIRMGRGKMMGVDQNRDMEWVGASAGLFPASCND
ncbi:MAG: hypothetical protein ACR2NN_20170 [Bryobacteraceae bacterium]